MALSAVGLIFENLRTAYRDGGTCGAREDAAGLHLRRLAFTRANVGYVPSRHQFGGRYHTPHGLANAILLPHVLRYSLPGHHRPAGFAGGARASGRRGESGDCWRRSSSTPWKQLERDIGIPTHLAALKEADIPALARPPAPKRTPATRCRAT